MAVKTNEVFNYVQGSDISGESSFDIWKSLTGKTDRAEFLEYLRSGPQGETGATGATGASAYETWKSIPGNEDKSEEDFIKFITGADGKSAYQTWLDLGNVGDENTFITAIRGLQGPSGDTVYALWKSLGNEGDAYDFFKALKGDAGESTYDIWLGCGHVGTPDDFIKFITGPSAYQTWLDLGNEGTEEDFINSITGTLIVTDLVDGCKLERKGSNTTISLENVDIVDLNTIYESLSTDNILPSITINIIGLALDTSTNQYSMCYLKLNDTELSVQKLSDGALTVLESGYSITATLQWQV